MSYIYQNDNRNSPPQMWQYDQSPSSSNSSGHTYIYKERGKLASLVECLRCTNMHAMPYSIPFKILFLLFFSESLSICILPLQSHLPFYPPILSFIFKIHLGLGLNTHTPTQLTHPQGRLRYGKVGETITDPVPLGPWPG